MLEIRYLCYIGHVSMVGRPVACTSAMPGLFQQDAGNYLQPSLGTGASFQNLGAQQSKGNDTDIGLEKTGQPRTAFVAAIHNQLQSRQHRRTLLTAHTRHGQSAHTNGQNQALIFHTIRYL